MKKDNFKLDLLITMVGQGMVMVASFALNKILSNYLSIESYGIYNIVRRTANVISYLMILALGIAIPKYLAMALEDVDKTKYKKYVIASIEILLLTILAISSVLMLAEELVVNIIFGSEEYSLYVLPIVLFSAGTTVSTYVYSFYRGNGAFYKYNIAQIFTQLLSLLIAWYWKKDVYTILMVWGISLLSIYGTRILFEVFTQVNGLIKIEKKVSVKNELRELLSFCIPRVPGEFVLFSYTVVPTIIVSSKFGVESSAFYSVGFTINTTITSLFSMVGVILLPLVSKSIANKSFSLASTKIDMLERIYFVLSLFFTIVIWVLTSLVIRLLFSDDYLYSIPLVRMMAMALLPQSFYLLLRNPLDAISKVPYNSINLAISFALLIIVTLISKNLIQAVGAVVISYWILGILTVCAWNKCKKSVRENENENSKI